MHYPRRISFAINARAVPLSMAAMPLHGNGDGMGRDAVDG